MVLSSFAIVVEMHARIRCCVAIVASAEAVRLLKIVFSSLGGLEITSLFAFPSSDDASEPLNFLSSIMLLFFHWSLQLQLVAGGRWRPDLYIWCLSSFL